MATDETDPGEKPWQFKRGQSGNPGGRPKGSRARLSEDFLRDLYEAWQQRGEEAVTRVMNENPEAFMRMIVRLMPKHLRIEDLTPDRTSMSREQILAKLGGIFNVFAKAGILEAALLEAMKSPSFGSASLSPGDTLIPQTEGNPKIN